MASIFQTHRRKIIFAGAAAGIYFGAPMLGIPLPNPFRTTGVANIEKRYSAGGASTTHTPATATKRGDHDHVVGNVETSKGMGTKHWQDHVAGQKPEGSTFDKAFNNANYGSEKGK